MSSTHSSSGQSGHNEDSPHNSTNLYNWQHDPREDEEEGESENEENEDEEDEDYDDDDNDDDDDDDDDGLFPGNFEFELLIEEIPAGSDQADGSNGDEEGTSSGHRRTTIRIGPGIAGRSHLTQREFLAILRGQHLHPVVVYDENGRERVTFRIGNPNDVKRYPKVPNDEGRKLMESGAFGYFDRRGPEKKALARRLLDRELGIYSPERRRLNQGLMAQSMVPSSKPDMVIHYDDPVCCGQFSDDGNFFYACVKDFKVRLYDTSSPYNWKHYKTVRYPGGQWTMTDADLSPDNKWLAFSSLQSHVGISPTDPHDAGEPYTLDLADSSGLSNGSHDDPQYAFGSFPIFSVRFSRDGRQLVAGTGARSIVVYDIEARRSLFHVRGHADDVNAVCFADKYSPHILYSGSDDCTIKVWDTRSIGEGREAGAFVGHTEGLTYIDSKGDGRYILSNAKDQTLKLWDLRMAMSATRFAELDPTSVTRNRDYEYDYRWQEYEEYQWFPHPHDNSLVTFRGHRVQRTLIRCHFSPPNSTDSRYVYAGSYDGHVYVWNMDATLAAKIDVRSTTRPPAGLRHRPERRFRLGAFFHRRPDSWEALVRDVAWHPNAPIVVASSWSGSSMDCGTASLHSFNDGFAAEDDEGDPPMGFAVDEHLESFAAASSSGLR